MKKNIGRIISMLLVCTMLCTGNLSTALGADFSGETDIIAEEEIVDAEPCSEDTELCEDSEVCDETEICEEIELLDEAGDAEETEDDILSLSAASGESYVFTNGSMLTAGKWSADRYTFSYEGNTINYALYYSSSHVFSKSELSSVQYIGEASVSASKGSFATESGLTIHAKAEDKYGHFDYTNAGPGYYRYLIYINDDKEKGFLTSPYFADYTRTSRPYNLGVNASGKFVEWNPIDTNPYLVEFYYYNFDEAKYEYKYRANGFNHKTSIPDDYDYKRPMYFRVKVHTDQGGWSLWTQSSIFYPSDTNGKIKDIHFGDPANGQDPNKIYWNNNLNSEKKYDYYYEAEVHTINANGEDIVLGAYESENSLTSTKVDGDISDTDAFDVVYQYNNSFKSLADIKNPFYVLITAYECDGTKKLSEYSSEERKLKALTKQTMSQKFYFWGDSYAPLNRWNDGKITTTIRKSVQPNTEFFEGGVINSFSYQWQYLNKIATNWKDIEGATKVEYSPTPDELEVLVNANAKIRVKIRNRDYAGELISDEIYAEAVKTVKGYVDITFRAGDNVLDEPRPTNDTYLRIAFIPEDNQGLGIRDLKYKYELYCDGVKISEESVNSYYDKGINTLNSGKTYKCKVVVTVDGGDSELVGDTFWSNEITILRPIMDAPGFYNNTLDPNNPYNPTCHSFQITWRKKGTEISVTKKGEVHTFSSDDIYYGIKSRDDLKNLIVDNLEGNTEYEVAYMVPSNNPDYDSCEGTLIAKTKEHTAKKDSLGPTKYYHDHSTGDTGDASLNAALPQNVHAKYCTECNRYFDIERHIDDDHEGDVGYKKCDTCGANYSEEGLYIESIGTLPGEKAIYTGKAIKPAVKVYVGDTLLTEGKDYKITYKNNVKACSKDAKNAPSVTVTGIGNYKGTCTEYFTIEPFALGEDKVSGEDFGKPSEGVSVADVAVADTGKDIKISPVVKVNGATLKQGTDYEVRESVGDSEIKSLKVAGLKPLYVCGIGNYSGAVKFNFEISNDKLISKIKFNKIPDQNYTGEPIAIDDILFVSGKPAKTLKEEFGEGNYKVTYSNKLANGEVKEDNNTDIGTVTATITAKSGSGYCTTGSTTITYKIVGNDISKATVEKIPNQVYTGKSIKPVLSVKFKAETVAGKEDKTLTEDVDYVVEYDGTNVNAGTAKGTIRGIGIYSGSKKITFKITPYPVTDLDDNVITYCNGGTEYKAVEYSPKGAKCSAVEAKFKTGSSVASLTEGVDYTVSYSNNTAVNEQTGDVWENPSKIPTAKFTFKGNFKGTRTVNFEICKRSLGTGVDASSGVEAADVVVSYKEGKLYTPKFKVTVDGVTLKEGVDYEVYKNNGDIVYPIAEPNDGYGESKMLISGKGSYNGSFIKQYVVTSKLLVSNIKFIKIPDQNYTGKPITIREMPIVAGKPNKTVDEWFSGNGCSTKSSNKLADGTVLSEDSTQIGTVTTTIIAASAYCEVDSTTVSFKIVENNISKATVEKIPNQVYTGKEIMPAMTVKFKAVSGVKTEEHELEADKDYEVDYAGTNINVGTAKVTIRGIGIYTGTKSFTFKIVPTDVSTDTDKITVCDAVTGSESISAAYSPSGAKPTPVVKFGDEELVLNKDYTISYANNKALANASDAKAPTMTLKFKGRFKGSRVIKYNITQKSITADDISISIPDVVYTDKSGPWKSKVVIKDGNKTLKEDTDYEILYKYREGTTQDTDYEKIKDDDDVVLGKEVFVFITGKGNYKDGFAPDGNGRDYKYTYRICKYDISKATVGKLSSNLEYIGPEQGLTFKYDSTAQAYIISDAKGHSSVLTVTMPGEKDPLLAGTAYKIVEDGYINNENVGSASFTIQGAGIYCGTKVVKFSIIQRVFVWWKKLFE